MRFLIFGSRDLVEPLKTAGHEVICAGTDDDADLCIPDPDPEWALVSKKLRTINYQPDIVLVNDNIGQRTLPTGLWGSVVPTIFYGLDAPLNRFWQTPYARLFDLAALDQKPDVELLRQKHDRSFWLPVGINPDYYEGSRIEPEKPGVCFIGVINDQLRPKRSAVLKKIHEIATVATFGGRQDKWFSTVEAVKCYQSYMVSLNENLFPGLTTRPLEIMASGGCLFSEQTNSGMDDYFRDNEHLLYYNPANISENLKELLKNQPLRQKLAKHGREEVLAQHTLSKRVKQLLSLLQYPMPVERVNAKLALPLEGEALLWAGLRWPQHGARRILRARGRLKVAASTLQDSYSCFLAGMAEAALNQWDTATAFWEKGWESANKGENKYALILGLGLWQQQKESAGKKVWKKYLDIKSTPGKAVFHEKAGNILFQAGDELCAGFNKANLWFGAWTAMEHWLYALQLGLKEKKLSEDLAIALGSLLLKHKAPNQAYDCLSLVSNSKNPQLQELTEQAAREGYII